MNTTQLRPVALSHYSQPHVLQQRMKEANLSHGETVTANLSPVRLERNFGHTIMYFCPMNNIEVIDRITPGDGGSIPPDAKVIDLNIPADLKPGLYELQNVKLFSNGTMQVIATEETQFKVLFEEPVVSAEVIERTQREQEEQRERIRRQREQMAVEAAEARRALTSRFWPF